MFAPTPQLTYEADGEEYPDPLLMVAYEAVPFIFYAENQFTTVSSQVICRCL